MIKIKYIFLYFLLFFVYPVLAQQNPSFQANRTYNTAMDLLEKEKYAAAAEQFRQVDESRLKTSNQPQLETELSLLKENSQYYVALCALELGNDDAESLFLKFIKEHPENPLTKMAYFEIGRSYSKKGMYHETLEWFNKVDAADLNGLSNTEYKFRKGYAYFSLGDNKNAQLLFSEVKNKRSPFTDDATYYFAYISYLNKDYQIALVNFEKLKNSKKYINSYPYYISAVYFLDKRYDDVIAYAIPILNSTHQQHETEMFRIVGASYFAKSDYPNAVKYYTRFEENDMGKTQSTQDSYQMGYAFNKTGNYSKAAEELKKLVEQNDVYSQNGSYILGDVFLKLGDKQSARNAYFAASRLTFDPQLQQDGLYEYAKLSYELDFYTNALDATRLYLKTYPQSRADEMKILLGEELLNSHNYKEAVDILEPIPNKNLSAQTAYQKVTYYRGLEFYNERAFENAIGIFLRSLKNPVDPKIRVLSIYWMAESMYEVRKYGEAVDNFEKFLAIPQSKQTAVFNYANYGLGYAEFGAEKYKLAASYFEKFLAGGEKDPTTVNDATTRIGDSYFVLKSYPKALESYNKIIAQHSHNEDYALFQRGMIEGLQGSPDAKIATLQEVLSRFPKSDYADDADFEIAYTYYSAKNDGATANADFEAMIKKYPNSSYVPRALVTIGLIDYSGNNDDAAIATFKTVIKDYPSTDEAKQALKQLERIYTDKGDAQTFITYATSTSIGNYTAAQQEELMITAANNLYLRGAWEGTIAAVNAYFDKFPTKPIYEKQARFIRAQSLVATNKPDEAVVDYNIVLNDWTSTYTEQSLLSMSKLYLSQKKYNEAIVFLKRLETNSEYKADYTYAINNLLLCYAQMKVPDDALKYVKLVRENDKSSQEDKFKTGLYAGLAYLQKGDTTSAVNELDYTVTNTKTIAAAEAKYNLANIEYLKKQYKASQKTCFDLQKDFSGYDYWVAKAFILLADNYVKLKDTFQAKATLQSIVDNYKGDDDILPTAKQKLDALSPNRGAPPTDQQAKPDTTQNKKPGNEE